MSRTRQPRRRRRGAALRPVVAVVALVAIGCSRQVAGHELDTLGATIPTAPTTTIDPAADVTSPPTFFVPTAPVGTRPGGTPASGSSGPSTSGPTPTSAPGTPRTTPSTPVPVVTPTAPATVPRAAPVTVPATACHEPTVSAYLSCLLTYAGTGWTFTDAHKEADAQSLRRGLEPDAQHRSVTILGCDRESTTRTRCVVTNVAVPSGGVTDLGDVYLVLLEYPAVDATTDPGADRIGVNTVLQCRSSAWDLYCRQVVPTAH